MVKQFKCKFCGKALTGSMILPHIIIEIPNAIKKLIGDRMSKLIIKDGKLIKVEDSEVIREVEDTLVEEKVEKIIPRAEVAPKEILPEQIKEEFDVETVEEQPVEQVEETTEEIAEITYYFVLRSGIKTHITIPLGELEVFRKYLNESLVTKPLLMMENKIIPVAAIDLIYFQ